MTLKGKIIYLTIAITTAIPANIYLHSFSFENKIIDVFLFCSIMFGILLALSDIDNKAAEIERLKMEIGEDEEIGDEKDDASN
ncbi:MAG: hypothetical protein ACE5ES_01030 [Candidatus Nanoarchaeia archaeon]